MVIVSPNLLSCFFLLVDVRRGTDDSGCPCSAVEVAAEARLDMKISHLYYELVVLFEIWSPPVCLKFGCPVFTLSSSSLAILLTRKVQVEFLGCTKVV